MLGARQGRYVGVMNATVHTKDIIWVPRRDWLRVFHVIMRGKKARASSPMLMQFEESPLFPIPTAANGSEESQARHWALDV